MFYELSECATYAGCNNYCLEGVNPFELILKRNEEIEKDEKFFLEIIDEVRSSDGVLWVFGLFVLAIPSQYMRFRELISECEQNSAEIGAQFY